MVFGVMERSPTPVTPKAHMFVLQIAGRREAQRVLKRGRKLDILRKNHQVPRWRKAQIILSIATTEI